MASFPRCLYLNVPQKVDLKQDHHFLLLSLLQQKEGKSQNENTRIEMKVKINFCPIKIIKLTQIWDQSIHANVQRHAHSQEPSGAYE